jgi:hypothetical protein
MIDPQMTQIFADVFYSVGSSKQRSHRDVIERKKAFQL